MQEIKEQIQRPITLVLLLAVPLAWLLLKDRDKEEADATAWESPWVIQSSREDGSVPEVKAFIEKRFAETGPVAYLAWRDFPNGQLLTVGVDFTVGTEKQQTWLFRFNRKSGVLERVMNGLEVIYEPPQ